MLLHASDKVLLVALLLDMPGLFSLNCFACCARASEMSYASVKDLVRGFITLYTRSLFLGMALFGCA